MSICISEEFIDSKMHCENAERHEADTADCRKVTISIFFDFSKTFDRMQHDILIRKLRDIEFSPSVL